MAGTVLDHEEVVAGLAADVVHHSSHVGGLLTCHLVSASFLLRPSCSLSCIFLFVQTLGLVQTDLFRDAIASS